MPVISSVILSWNRSYLLKRCILTYLQTTSFPFELIIVDNRSIDGARNFIRRICGEHSNLDYIFLSSNEGGKAINFGFSKAKARLFHVSENDLVYKQGWDRKALKMFDLFPELGQLSLFSPFDPVRTTGKGHKYYHHKLCREGHTIFVTDKNVGTSSIFRREIWEKGIRWTNCGSTRFKFPDDYSFSANIIKEGYLVAWNEEYLVDNQGHSIEEFKNNLPYYLKNYQAKKRGMEKLKRFLFKNGYILIPENQGKLNYRIIPFK